MSSVGSCRSARISGRDHERLVPALDHPHVAGAQNAEPGFEHGLERILADAELVFANAEEGEVVVDQPREKCDSFGDLVRRHRRRVGFELDDHILDALHHRPPVGDAEADVGKHPFDGRDDVGAARLVIDRFEMDVDDALARHPGSGFGLFEGGETARRVARDGQNGMHDEANVDAAFGQLRQHRVDQERHVVVDDLEHRLVAPPLSPSGRRHRIEADVRHARLAHGEQGPGVGGKFGELARVVAQKIFRAPREQKSRR